MLMGRGMAKELILMPVAVNTLVILEMVNITARELFRSLMAVSTKASTKTTNDTVEVF